MSKENKSLLNLTQSQLSIWTSQKFHEHVPLHNVVRTFEITGALDEITFKKAFQELLNRTDVLRTTFVELNGTPYQSFQDGFKFEIEVINLTSYKEITIQEWISSRAGQILDLSKAPFDTVLLQIEKEKYIWYLNLHHLITDGATTALLYAKMNEIYSEIRNGNFSQSLESLPFEDYVHFENAQVNNAENKAHGSFWKEKLDASLELPKLYGNQNLTKSTIAERIEIPLGKELSRRLKELAVRPEIRGWTEDSTLFNILTTLLFIYINRISSQEKLAIGVPVHNRTHKKFHKTAGLFIEVFPMINALLEDDTFLSVYKRVKQENNAFLKNAKPGVFSLEIGRSFNVVMNYIKTRFPNFYGMPMKTEWIHPGHVDHNHLLRLHVIDYHGDDEITLLFDLNNDAFDAELQQSVPKHLLALLDAMLADIHTPVRKPSLTTSEEKESLLALGTKANEPKNAAIFHFEEMATSKPNAIAVQYREEILTYSTLNKKANQLAHFLQKKGIGAPDKVALHLYRNTDYLVSVLAVMKTGAAFIPIASDHPISRIKFILEDSRSSLVLTESGLLKNFRNGANNVIDLASIKSAVSKESSSNKEVKPSLESMAYILYTSGSTGNPKGVLIPHKGLSNYLIWAKSAYNTDQKSVFALFTSIGFDLTITATLLPLISGGRIHIYKENKTGPDTALLTVLDDNNVNTIKLTPSHLALLAGKDLKNSFIKTMIIGGEDFKVSLAKNIKSSFHDSLEIYNEYGPTEATVGCIVSKFTPERHQGNSVPIGKPIANMKAYILDHEKNMVPKGVHGELYLSGIGLANGYANSQTMTDEKFIDNPFFPNSKMYRTGDLARLNSTGEFEYLGRTDEQVKLRGHRIELTDIEANIIKFPQIENCAVVLVEGNKTISEAEVINCAKCGLPSNYPETDFNENGVCHLCKAFETYKDKADRYFKNDEQLVSLLTSKRDQSPNYDCISLLSGGKDSTFVLARLINMGLKVLAFTMDNGYISDQAKANIDRIVTKLGVDHVYGETPHMNEIFVDSLHRHHNVCNGCFKTIYTLSTKIALEKEIPFIVTGLSRGQFFETRLTEELFWDDTLDVTKIDETILEARKIYHQESDAVKRLLDTSMFDDDEVFDKVEFVDFYRFSDVSLEEMLQYLKNNAGWVRPTDTGRSTNCLINQVGIYVHKKELGYSNYSFPYSWDVRLGHKTRNESLEEINEVIDEAEVKRIMEEIGYDKTTEDWANNDKLVAYYTGSPDVSIKELKSFISKKIPLYMVPTVFKHLDKIPLTINGKTDKKALKNLNDVQLEMDTPYMAPRNEIEELLEHIWAEVLQLKQIGVHDNFIALGGHSLAAIRVTARINEEIEVNFSLNKVFEFPTIATYANYIEETLLILLEK